MWEDIIFFRAFSGADYELLVLCHKDPPPKRIEEGPDGGIFEPEGDRCWNSLAEMTHELKFEIISFASEVGD
jgi:hypothetical protein